MVYINILECIYRRIKYNSVYIAATTIYVHACTFSYHYNYAHTVGVSMILHKQPTPNNSLVDVDDVLYTDLHNGILYPQKTLLCVTDNRNCCWRRPKLGNWYFPNGSTVQENSFETFSHVSFRIFRIQSYLSIHGHRYDGEVILYRRYFPSDRGHFRCELPDAKNIIHTLYANIGETIMLHK